MSILVPSKKILVPSRSLSLPTLGPYSVYEEKEGVLYEAGTNNPQWVLNFQRQRHYNIFGDLYLDAIREEREHKGLLGSLKSRIFGDKREQQFFLETNLLSNSSFEGFFEQMNIWLDRDYKQQILREDADLFFLEIYEYFKAISDEVNKTL